MDMQARQPHEAQALPLLTAAVSQPALMSAQRWDGPYVLQAVPRRSRTGTWCLCSPRPDTGSLSIRPHPTAATCPALNGSHRCGGPHMQPKHSSHSIHGPLIHHDLGPRPSLLSWLQQWPPTQIPYNNMQPSSLNPVSTANGSASPGTRGRLCQAALLPVPSVAWRLQLANHTRAGHLHQCPVGALPKGGTA